MRKVNGWRLAAGVGLLGLGMALGLWVRGGAAAPPKAEKPADPLADLALGFRGLYAKARAETLARMSPVVLVNEPDDGLTLLHKGERKTGAGIPPRYHELKAVSHLPLAIFAVFGPFGGGEVPAERLADVRQLRELALKARAELPARKFPPAMLARQEGMIDGSVAFLDAALEAKLVEPAALTAFCRKHAPALIANFHDAARAQIETTHATMTAWRKDLTDAEWNGLHVVVLGAQMPRKENIAVQYFAALLGERGEGRRIVYAEGLWDEKKSLNLLATHTLDSAVGVAFFHDPERMERDVLGDPAKEILQTFPFEK
jgi:hypothetical protein